MPSNTPQNPSQQNPSQSKVQALKDAVDRATRQVKPATGSSIIAPLSLVAPKKPLTVGTCLSSQLSFAVEDFIAAQKTPDITNTKRKFGFSDTEHFNPNIEDLIAKYLCSEDAKQKRIAEKLDRRHPLTPVNAGGANADQHEIAKKRQDYLETYLNYALHEIDCVESKYLADYGRRILMLTSQLLASQDFGKAEAAQDDVVTAFRKVQHPRFQKPILRQLLNLPNPSAVTASLLADIAGDEFGCLDLPHRKLARDGLEQLIIDPVLLQYTKTLSREVVEACIPGIINGLFSENLTCRQTMAKILGFVINFFQDLEQQQGAAFKAQFSAHRAIFWNQRIDAASAEYKTQQIEISAQSLTDWLEEAVIVEMARAEDIFQMSRTLEDRHSLRVGCDENGALKSYDYNYQDSIQHAILLKWGASLEAARRLIFDVYRYVDSDRAVRFVKLYHENRFGKIKRLTAASMLLPYYSGNRELAIESRTAKGGLLEPLEADSILFKDRYEFAAKEYKEHLEICKERERL